MSKDTFSLAESRRIREGIIRKYGFVPTSILEPQYSWGKDIIEYDKRKQDVVSDEKHKHMSYNIVTYQGSDGKEKTFQQPLKEFSSSGKNVRGKNSGISTFPPALAKFITEFYSSVGETIVDPFAGHNSRMQVTYQLDRNYIGYDVSKDFMEFNRDVQRKITEEQLFSSNKSIILREQSSEKLVEEDCTADLIYTSPPYYCVEYYGDEKEQLGLSGSYDLFMARMDTIIKECFRVVKKDRFCVFNVNDFRMDNKFYPYHADIMRSFTSAGFKLHDIVIVKWKSCIGACFASQVEDRKMTAKTHEYLIVGKK